VEGLILCEEQRPVFTTIEYQGIYIAFEIRRLALGMASKGYMFHGVEDKEPCQAIMVRSSKDGEL
jgi:hypothetical protein